MTDRNCYPIESTRGYKVAPESSGWNGGDPLARADATNVHASGRDALPVCLGRENPNRLVSLWYIVKQFEVAQLVNHVAALDAICFDIGTEPKAEVTSTERDGVLAEILATGEYCRSIGFAKSHRKILQSVTQFRSPWQITPTWILAEARNVRESLIADLDERKFLVIDTKNTEWVDNPCLFGADVSQAFPEAAADICEAGNCLAVGCDTAAVFHLMRTAEHGLRRIAKRLRVRVAHKNRFMPLELAEWNKIIGAIQTKIAHLRTRPKNARQQSQIERYSDAADHCLFMKDIWRNTVSHTRKQYNTSEAAAALGRVRDFMVFLAGTLCKPHNSVPPKKRVKISPHVRKPSEQSNQ
jgi:hypothetical protein